MCNYGSYVFNEGKQEGIIEGKKEGLLEGKKEGLLEGKKVGLLEGKKEGLLEGRFEAILELIKKKMNKKGLSPIESMIELDIEEKDYNLYISKLEERTCI